ncbi:hypothetical protein CEP51_001931 [Fusarium floridanum]|uniref:Beta-lactamase-related domain-containing protein n=1 Tax=Fusarium floridanum TaxID=1325733 RepID=A0A428SE93_9HYPO|nr:hypothetical protein CEP51_001931 [Fusarium floridanum]
MSNLTAHTHAGNHSALSLSDAPYRAWLVAIVGHADAIASEFAYGKRKDATVDTIYDIASLTKLFTTVGVLKQIDTGKTQLQERVSKYVPSFGVNGKKEITILMLLTHTSGFDADPAP